MTLSDLASLGSFISGVAVLVSLIYLSLQIRQAEKNQQATIRAARAGRMIEMNIAAMDPLNAEAIAKGSTGAPDMTPTEYAQFASFCRASFVNAEDTYFQHKQGLLADEAFQSFRANVRAWSRQPGLPAFWQRHKAFYVPEFAQWLDETISDVRLDPPGDALAQWKADVEALKARNR